MANYESQFSGIGFSYDSLTATGYNKINGISFIVHIEPSSKDYTIYAACRPYDQNNDSALSADLQKFASERQKIVKNAFFNGKQIIICCPLNFTANIVQGVNEAVTSIMNLAGIYQCVPCCSVCGRTIETDIYTAENSVIAMCTDCFSSYQHKMFNNMQTDAQTITNYPMGTIGALLGGLAGAVIWVLASMMGRISMLAGLVSGFAGIYGFKMLGKKLSASGIAIAAIISLCLLLAGMYIATGIDLFNTFKDYGYELSFSETLECIPYALEDEDYRGAFIYNNIWGLIAYTFSVILTAVQLNKEKQIKNRVFKLM